MRRQADDHFGSEQGQDASEQHSSCFMSPFNAFHLCQRVKSLHGTHGAFCLPKTKDEVKNKKSRILSFCNQGMEKMFVIVIHSTTGVNGLLRTEMLQG